MTFAERFMAKTRADTSSACVLWTASTHPFGYGWLRIEGRTYLAHRVAWLLEHGVWPADCLLHICDTPGCVNVDHLREGSHADNAADCIAKGRHSTPPRLTGERNGFAKLTDQQVSEIRRRLAGAPRGMAAQLAWEYGVSAGTIGHINTGRNWKGH